MIELLVVIVVIGILISSVLVAGSALITRSKINNTKATIQVVLDACEEFKHEQAAATRGSLTSAQQDAANPTPGHSKVKYSDRYGQYPPDELEVFTPNGLPGSKSNSGTLAPRGAVMIPAANGKYPAMRFYDVGSNAAPEFEHRDLAAMIVAIEVIGESSASILSKIPDKNRTAGALNTTTGQPSQFLDRPSGAAAPDGNWGPDDLQIRYIVDDWGNPLSYFSERDHKDLPTDIASSNHEDWNDISTELVRLNGGQPLIMSYGPDGKEQLTQSAMASAPSASLVGDLSSDNHDHLLNNPFNNDNVYSNTGLAEKLAKGYGG